MRIIFFGAEPKVGTSANMQLAACGAFFHPLSFDGARRMPMQFADCKKTDIAKAQRQILSSDLCVANISLGSQALEELFLNMSFVHKNIIFLVGKYYHSQERELERFSRWYRIPMERICTIPCNQRFKEAYESGSIPSYLKWQLEEPSFENMQFQQSLKGLLLAIAKFGKRKGEIYYG